MTVDLPALNAEPHNPPSPAGAQAGVPGSDVRSAEQVLAGIAQQMDAQRGGQVVHVEHLDVHKASYATLSPLLPASLQATLRAMGIPRLYTHQVEAIQRVRNGENVVVVTATSSGKTLCYNLPVLETILQDRSARALYIYPINALVNDQLKSLFRMNLALGREAVGVGRYTGSLRSEQRKAVRLREPNILLTNPEMLHLSFLLWHRNWETLWRNLRYIVVDEVHTYRGVFGSNMAYLFRRMLRMAEHYGSSPQFICCSATIANPKELAERLTGRKFSVVDHDGSAKGRKLFVLWNPPLVGDDASNVRRSYVQESVDLLSHCLRAHYNTIVFARARRLTERMLRMSHNLVEDEGEEALPERISSYRAGYLAQEREEIESKLKTGQLQGVITTNALEMGIDIGGLDAAIIAGYPGTIMSTWQQAGRAGRRGRDALVFLVASQNALDQYYVNHSDEFFAQPHELAVVDLDNQYIRLKHLLCSARELPLDGGELDKMSTNMRIDIDDLREAGLLEALDADDGSDDLSYPQDRRPIHFQVSLRAASHESYKIINADRNEIGTIEPPNVYRETHPGAIYQHGGDAYRVVFLDRQHKTVRVREEQIPHYTRSSRKLNLRIESTYASRTLKLGDIPSKVTLGEVLVEETVYSYQELRLGSDEMVKRVNLTYPLVMRLHTTAMWVSIPPEIRDIAMAVVPVLTNDESQEAKSSKEALFGEGLHAIQHLFTGVMPLLVMCDRRDVDGYYHVEHPDLNSAAVFVYDSYEGGIGLAEIAYQRAEELPRLAYETVSRCRCESGCPSCIQSGVCRLRNESLNKQAALAILSRLSAQSVASHIEEPSAALYAASPLPRAGASPAPRYRLAQSKKRAIQELAKLTQRRNLSNHLSDVTAPPPEPQFAKGDRVKHSSYGLGRVISSRIQGQRELVTVRFRRRGRIQEVDGSRGTLRKVESGEG